jgi:peptidoglycan/LPS O-acetylase OafA/YrhL
MAAEGDETGDGAGGGDRSDHSDRSDRSNRSALRSARRARAKSAALWGLVGGFAFLVLAQGFLIVEGTLPVDYGGLVGLAAAVAVASGGIAYATEHRLRSKRVKRRT